MKIFDFFKRKKETEETELEVNSQLEINENEINDESFQENENSIEEDASMDKLVEEDLASEETPEEILIEDEPVLVAEEVAIPDEEILEEVLIEETSYEAPPEKKQGFLKKFISGLDKTRKNLLSGVENVLKGFSKIDEELFEELEEVLIMADLGVETATLVVESVKERVRKEKITEVESIKGVLIEEISKILQEGNSEFLIVPPTIILIIGVNGAGKTTTIGKLANIYKNQGRKVMLAAGDTFRAAAIDQLEVWANRSNVELIKHQENSDPAAVVFDAVKAAKARKTDILICDTAGRLHNKKNLMEELRKIFKVIGREYPEARIETLLVLDGTTGQNALQQAKSFKEVCDITGIILTKLDGTAKGGVVISIKNELQVPVRFIGVGEGIDDLQVFDAENFARALFYEN